MEQYYIAQDDGWESYVDWGEFEGIKIFYIVIGGVGLVLLLCCIILICCKISNKREQSRNDVEMTNGYSYDY